MPNPFGPGSSEQQIRDAIQALAAEARACEASPPAPDARGWGVPSWEDAAAYPGSEELDDLEWRWEFLRRRHGYRTDWLRPPQDFAPATRDQYFRAVYDLELPFDPRLSVRKLAEGHSTSSRRGTETIRYPYSGLVPFRGALLSRTIGDSRFWHWIIPEQPGPNDILARFDIGRPLKPQLDQAEYYLGLLREEAYGKDADKARRQATLWPTYLRLLDAADRGASLREMIAALPDHVVQKTQQAADKMLQAAERLRREWRHGSRPVK
jgi:hypothetical protein